MNAIPNQLAAKLKETKIRLSTPVKSAQASQVTLAFGEAITARSIVLATEGIATARLLKRQPAVTSRGVTCLYFAAERTPLDEPSGGGSVRLEQGLYVCGDHIGTASINGAFESGRLAAEAVIADVA